MERHKLGPTASELTEHWMNCPGERAAGPEMGSQLSAGPALLHGTGVTARCPLPLGEAGTGSGQKGSDMGRLKAKVGEYPCSLPCVCW